MCFTSHILLLFSSYTRMPDSLLYSLLLYTYNNNIKLLHWSIYELRLYIYFICDVKKYIDIKILTFTNITFILSSKYCRFFHSPKKSKQKKTHTKNNLTTDGKIFGFIVSNIQIRVIFLSALCAHSLLYALLLLFFFLSSFSWTNDKNTRFTYTPVDTRLKAREEFQQQSSSSNSTASTDKYIHTWIHTRGLVRKRHIYMYVLFNKWPQNQMNISMCVRGCVCFERIGL